MKKLIALTLTACMALGLSVMFAACDPPEPEHKTHYDVNADGDCDKCGEMMPGHEHILSLGWKTTETEHWRTATCHPSETVDRGTHTYLRSGYCSVCMMQEPLTVSPSVVDGWYYLQAEHAILEDGTTPSNRTMTVETGRNEFIVDPEKPGEGKDGLSVADIGYFGGDASTVGQQTITWKFTSDKEVKGLKIRFRASSGNIEGGWNGRTLKPTSLEGESAPTLTFNETKLDTTGMEIGITYTFTDAELGGNSNRMYCVFTEVEFTVDVKQGENVFVLGANVIGVNPDALMVEGGKANITFTKTDNSSRPGAHN